MSPNIRLRYPSAFEVGAHSIVDDYCYFATRVRIGVCSHVANNCSIGGGREYCFSLGDFSSLSAGVRVWCSSNDFVRDLIAITRNDTEDEPIHGDVTMGNFTGVGANSVVMPANDLPEGVAVGALSFVPSAYEFEPWTVYAGVPLRPIKARDRDRVLRQVEAMRRALQSEGG